MAKIEGSLQEIGRLDLLARQKTPLHALDPRAKLITIAVYLLCIASVGPYGVSVLLPFSIFPITMAAAGRVPFGFVARRLLAAAPFAVVVGMFNPLLDRQLLLQIGGVGISGGWISFASILIRFALTLGAALVLAAVTTMDELALGLRRLGVPSVFTTQLTFLFRYIFVLFDEAGRMARARALRSFGRRGLEPRAYAGLIGSLLLRTLDRANRVYLAMACRGFSGEVRAMRGLKIGAPELVFTLSWSSVFVFFRLVDVSSALGTLVTGGGA